MIEEQKYSEIRKKLRSLPRIGASKDFETRLYQRIQHEKQLGYRPYKEKENWILNIFRQPAFAPALAFASVVIIGLIVYLAFFTGNKQPELTSQQTSPVQKEYSVTQLESLKSKVGNIEPESREFASKEKLTPVSPKSRTGVIERKSDFESDFKDSRVEGQLKTEEQPLERTIVPEKMEKKEAPTMDKGVEEKQKTNLDEISKGIIQSKKSGVFPSIQNNLLDTAKSLKKKSKKVTPEAPPVEQQK